MGIVTFLSEPDLKFTKESVERMTNRQWEAISEMFENAMHPTKVCVYIDFSLPDDYVAFILTKNVNGTFKELYGGIDQYGVVST